MLVILVISISREGHVSVAEQLLAHGADVELPDNYGQSPLFMACWKGTSSCKLHYVYLSCLNEVDY